MTTLKSLRKAQKKCLFLSAPSINKTLEDLAQKLNLDQESILKANQLDLDKMDPSNPKYDRLKLTSDRISDMALGLIKLTKLESPIGRNLESKTLGNGLIVTRKSTPLGVIGMIYEARPNVTTDSFGIAFKTQNAIALKGGSDAQNTNQCLYKIIQEALVQNEIDKDIIYLLPPDREATKKMLAAHEDIDVIIPRGSQNLIQFVRENSAVPVIETGAGIVHTFWDATGHAKQAKRIIFSAKTRRPSVCNSLDTFLVHDQNLEALSEVLEPLVEKKVQIFADKKSLAKLQNHYPDNLLFLAEDQHFGTEFLGLKLSIKTVPSLEKALEHIDKHSSKHSESIITENQDHADYFCKVVDAACVFHNTETGFSDGEQMGLGAEIGISTQKLHARGPMGLEAMTSYKWIIEGTGQTRLD